MKTIARTYEKLGAQIGDKLKNRSSEKLAQTLIEKSESAKKYTPDKPDAAEKFNADISTMIQHLKALKGALRANNNSGAKEHFDALKPWTTPAHGAIYQ